MDIDGNLLKPEDIVSIARKFESVNLSASAIQNIKSSNKILETIINSSQPVYGINTGFGIFSEKRIERQHSALLSRNLILSHAVGSGEPLPEEVVRAAMLVRANTLAKGYSGVRLPVVTTILSLLNKKVTPLVPSQGSLGSSGDLIPLSHLALVFTTDQNDLENESGFALFDGKQLSGKRAMQAAGIERIILGPKEGLAINNGSAFSAAIAGLAVSDAQYLLDIADLALAISLEALLGCSAAFDHRLHEVRGHKGQILVAENILRLIKGSQLINCDIKVQDAYSLRCAPQVHGAVRDTVEYVNGIVTTEINAATDNPLLFEGDLAISGGNFHGEPVGFGVDFLKIAMAEIGAISERRVFRLIDSRLNQGLPPMLVDHHDAAGLNSGLMMPQYTAASLVLENQTLAASDSIHSLPTSGDQEDHVANSMTAARHARQIIENVRRILAIELYTAARALDLRLRSMPEKALGEGTQVTYSYLRSHIPYKPGDTWWGPEIDAVEEMIARQTLPLAGKLSS